MMKRKRTKQLGRTIVFSLLLLFLLAFTVSAATYKQTIKTSTKKLTMVTGEETKIRISGNSYSKKRTFTIKNKKVVKAKGQLLLALKKGTTAVTLKQGSKKAKFTVSVKAPEILFEGKFKLSVNGLNPAWSSSNQEVMDIDPKTGAITPKMTGRTFIYAAVHGVVYRVTVDYPGGNVIRILDQTSVQPQVPSPEPEKPEAPMDTPMPTYAPGIPQEPWPVDPAPSVPLAPTTPASPPETPSAEPTPIPAPTTAPPQNLTPGGDFVPNIPLTTTVWLPATGKYYHSVNNCGKMDAKKATPVTLEEALSRGFPACPKCWAGGN